MRECRRCLLKDMTDQEFYSSIQSYIEHLPEDMKAAEDVYEARLIKCKSCEELVNGMCRLCGCFAEVRAAKQPNRCPKPVRLW